MLTLNLIVNVGPVGVKNTEESVIEFHVALQHQETDGIPLAFVRGSLLRKDLFLFFFCVVS